MAHSIPLLPDPLSLLLQCYFGVPLFRSNALVKVIFLTAFQNVILEFIKLCRTI